MKYTYYAVCNAGGPISVKLDGETKAEALAAFETLNGRAAIDGAKTDAEDDLEIEDAQDMSESDFAEALEASGAEHVCDLEPIVNAHAGTVSSLKDGWTLWSVENTVTISISISDGMSRNAGGETTITADTLDAAIELAEEWVREGSYTSPDSDTVNVALVIAQENEVIERRTVIADAVREVQP